MPGVVLALGIIEKPRECTNIMEKRTRMSERTRPVIDDDADSPQQPPSRGLKRFDPTHRAAAVQGGLSPFDAITASAAAALHRAHSRFAALPAWAQVASVWALSRLWGFIVFWIVSMQQVAAQQRVGDGHRPGLLEYMGWWDAEWYERIYMDGYPSQLPVDGKGVVAHNTWAFLPAQPKIAGIIADTTGIPFAISTVLLSVAVSFALAWVLYLLFVGCLNWREHGVFETRVSLNSPHRSTAVWAVAAYGFCGPAAVFVTGYAEALTIFAIALFVLLLAQDRYLWALPVAFLAAQSRPVGVPLGALAGVWWLYCLVAEYRVRSAGQPRASSGRVFLAAFAARAVHLLSALTVCFFAFTHALHAAYKTGRLDAYLATELGWSGRTVEDGQHYVVQWVNELSLYLNRWSTGAIITLIMAGFAAYFLWLFSRSTRTLLHPVMLIWCVCYAVYLGIFWLPQSSTFRILLPLFPFALVLMSYGKDSKTYRWLMVLSGVLMQLVWVGWLWHSHGPGDMQLP